jgi:tRNA pseudouridine55 synthase
LQPVDAGLVEWPVVELDDDSANRFSHGNPVEIGTAQPGLVRAYSTHGKLLGIGEVNPNKLLKPKRIMNL